MTPKIVRGDKDDVRSLGCLEPRMQHNVVIKDRSAKPLKMNDCLSEPPEGWSVILVQVRTHRVYTSYHSIC
jgi:hypothetical protein